MQDIEVPDEVIKHILRKHRDIALILNIKDVNKLKHIIIDALSRPDEVYSDKYRVKYFLKRIDEEHWLNVVVQEDIVRKFRRKRWL